MADTSADFGNQSTAAECHNVQHGDSYQYYHTHNDKTYQEGFHVNNTSYVGQNNGIVGGYGINNNYLHVSAHADAGIPADISKSASAVGDDACDGVDGVPRPKEPSSADGALMPPPVIAPLPHLPTGKKIITRATVVAKQRCGVGKGKRGEEGGEEVATAADTGLKDEVRVFKYGRAIGLRYLLGMGRHTVKSLCS